MTEPVIAGFGSFGPYSESLLLSLRISGMRPANLRAPASRNPSGAAYALQPDSIAS